MTEGKLVRDGIPAIIRATGEDPDVMRVSGKESLDALFSKLEEEADELRRAVEPGDQIGDLADLLEVLRGLAEHMGIALADVEAAARHKRADRGGFTEGFWLASLATPRTRCGGGDPGSTPRAPANVRSQRSAYGQPW